MLICNLLKKQHAKQSNNKNAINCGSVYKVSMKNAHCKKNINFNDAQMTSQRQRNRDETRKFFEIHF